MGLYIRSRAVPPWVLILLCLSKRLHSIYLLRLFNDGVAMLVAYVAVWLLVSQRWRASLVAFSAAVSIKMNVLLMAPPVLLVMLKVSASDCVFEVYFSLGEKCFSGSCHLAGGMCILRQVGGRWARMHVKGTWTPVVQKILLSAGS